MRDWKQILALAALALLVGLLVPLLVVAAAGIPGMVNIATGWLGVQSNAVGPGTLQPVATPPVQMPDGTGLPTVPTNARQGKALGERPIPPEGPKMPEGPMPPAPPAPPAAAGRSGIAPAPPAPPAAGQSEAFPTPPVPPAEGRPGALSAPPVPPAEGQSEAPPALAAPPAAGQPGVSPALPGAGQPNAQQPVVPPSP